MHNFMYGPKKKEEFLGPPQSPIEEELDLGMWNVRFVSCICGVPLLQT